MSSQAETAPTEPIQLTDRNELEEAVSTYGVVLVDFYADWCGPCRMMEPAIESVAADTDAAVVKVDVDRFQGLASQYGVQGVPRCSSSRTVTASSNWSAHSPNSSCRTSSSDTRGKRLEGRTGRPSEHRFVRRSVPFRAVFRDSPSADSGSLWFAIARIKGLYIVQDKHKSMHRSTRVPGTLSTEQRKATVDRT